MVDESLFMSIQANTLQTDLVKILCRIAKEKGRVEIQNCDGGNCVMISKDELDSLEEALEILTRTAGIAKVTQCIQEYAAQDLCAAEPGKVPPSLINA